MNKNDLTKFAELMAGAAEVKNFTKLSDVGINLIFNALEKYKLSDIKMAVTEIIRDPNRKKIGMIEPDEIIFRIENIGSNLTIEESAKKAWLKMLKAVQQVGGHQSVVFDDPIINTIINETFNGWINLCKDLPGEGKDLIWIEKDFISFYKTCSKSEEHKHMVLIGVANQNRIWKGYKPEPPVIIGDKSKVQHLLVDDSIVNKDLKKIIGGIG